jgi:hypothetical protein
MCCEWAILAADEESEYLLFSNSISFADLPKAA